MKIFFSDRLAVYFIKKYVLERFPEGIKWQFYESPIFSSGAFLDRQETSRLFKYFKNVLSRINGQAYFCYTFDDIGDYFSFIILYKAYQLLPPSMKKEIRLVIGGPLLNFLNFKQMAAIFPEIKHMVIGAGEKAFLDILLNDINGKPSARIIYGNNQEKQRFPDPAIVNSALLKAHSAQGYYICSMNLDKCAWGRCRFCHHLGPDKVTVESIEQFNSEIIKVNRDYNIDKFYIFDNAITPRDLELLLCRLETEGLFNRIKIMFFGVRFDKQFLNLVPLVKRSRVVELMAWGLESCSQSVLDLYKKGIDARFFKPILKAYSETGVRNHIYVLFGLPAVSDEDINITCNELKKLQAYYEAIRLSWFVLSEGTDVFQNQEEFGITIGNKYLICDNLGIDILGKYNLETGFYDFDFSMGNKTLTRLDDFKRYRPFWEKLENNGVRTIFTPYQFFLKNYTEYIRFSSSMFYGD